MQLYTPSRCTSVSTRLILLIFDGILNSNLKIETILDCYSWSQKLQHITVENIHTCKRQSLLNLIFLTNGIGWPQVPSAWSVITTEYRSDDVTQIFFALQHFEYHISIEHDEKPPQPKFGGNQFMRARDMAAWIPN